jgi:hypothetical protein
MRYWTKERFNQRGEVGYSLLALIIGFLMVATAGALYIAMNLQMQPAANQAERVAARSGWNTAVEKTRPLIIKEINRDVMTVQQIINAGPGRGVEGSQYGVIGDRTAAGQQPLTPDEAAALLDKDFTVNPLTLDPGPQTFSDPRAQEAWDKARIELRHTSTVAAVRTRVNWVRPISDLGLPDDPALSPWVVGVSVYVDQVSEEMRNPPETVGKALAPPQRAYLWRPAFGPEQGVQTQRTNTAVPDDPHCLAQGMPHRDGYHLVRDAFFEGETTCRYEANVVQTPSEPVAAENGGRLVGRSKVMEGRQFKAVAAYHNGLMKAPGLVAPVIEKDRIGKSRYSGSYKFKYYIRFAKPDGTKAVEIPMPGDFNYVEPVPGSEPVMCGTSVSHPDVRNPGDIPVDGPGAMWSVITSCPGNNQNPDTGQVGGSYAGIRTAQDKARDIRITPPNYQIGKPTYRQTPNEWGGAVVPNTGGVSVPGTLGQSYLKLQVKFSDNNFESTPKFKRLFGF